MNDRREPLTEQEAERIGAWLGAQLGQGPGPEVLAAQRLRLSQKSMSKVTRGTHAKWWAVGGGLLAAAATTGAVQLIGTWRSGTPLVSGERYPGISAEPLALSRERANASAESSVVEAQPRMWSWRTTDSLDADKTARVNQTAHETTVTKGQLLDATSRPVWLELASNDAVSQGHVRLVQGARARIVDAEALALTVSLERGSASAAFHESASRVVMMAGPFSVRPTDVGEYAVDWAPRTGVFGVRVTSGEVEVTVASTAARHTLKAGQTLELTAAVTRSKSQDTRKPRTSTASVNEVSTLERETKVAGTVATAAPSLEQAPVVSKVNADGGRWRQLAENGQYAAAVKEAEKVGFSSLEQSVSASDLLLLADVARLGGAPQRARGVLTALRSRYPGHTNAATAAFTLGRMAQELDHDDRRAMQWYRTYLKEEPQGRMAEGARARLLKATLRVGSQAEKEQAARDYLAHHPTGSSAGVARSMLSK